MRTLLASLVLAASVGGCGLGPGGDDPAPSGVSLLVTRDFGAEEIGRTSAEGSPAGETVMRLLQRSFDVETRYGGGFVQSIDGLAGGGGGREVDWFYYVNGIEADEGAAARKLAGGDRVWWDHHDWSAAQRVPAVVGSYPEPFASGIEGERLPVRVDCDSSVDRVCDEVARRLAEHDVRGVAKAGLGASSGVEVLRLVVGPWVAARRDPVAKQIEDGPGESGVFARPSADGATIDLLDQQGEVVRTLGEGAGLLAAVRYSEQQPTWFVTGTDAVGVAAAAAALDEGVLEGRFAVAIEDGRVISLPVRPEER